MTNEPTKLDYSYAVKWHGRRSVRRWIVAGAILAAVTFSGWRWGPGIVDQWKYLRWQSGFLNRLDAPGTVLYEEDPAESAWLIQTGNYVVVPYGGTFAGTDWNPAALSKNLDKPWLISLYLHRATSPTRPERIVKVFCETVNEEELGHGRIIKLSVRVWQKASLWPGSRIQQLTGKEFTLFQGLGAGDYVRFYGGQPDPKDRSRFTIRYQLNGVDGVIDGQITEQDEIELKRRDDVTSPSSATRLPAPTAGSGASGP